MDFKTFTEAMFGPKHLWKNVTDSDKETFSFIFNSYMCKKYPDKAQYFNDKNTDKVTMCNIWKASLQNSLAIPFWFWKGKRTLEKKERDVLLDEIILFFDLDKKDILNLSALDPTLLDDIINEYKLNYVDIKDDKIKKNKKIKAKSKK